MGHEELKRAFALAIAPSVVEHALKLSTESAISQIVINVWDLADNLAAGATLRRCTRCNQMRNSFPYEMLNGERAHLTSICYSCLQQNGGS